VLIGLCGKPHSGKSEVRYILEKQFGFETINAKLPIIRACHELTGIPIETFTTQKGKETLYKGVPLRVIMGSVGAAMEELLGEYHTIERAIAEYDTSKGNFVVDSLRMSQPLHFTGYVVKVLSPRSIDTGNAFDQWDDSNTHFTIHNDGNFADLEKEVARLLDYVGSI
jgi:dephospho-CoA kinase